MKLHSPNGIFFMLQPHDFFFRRPGGYPQAGGKTVPFHQQGVVAGSVKGARKTREYPFTTVVNRTGLAMHQIFRPDDTAAESLTDGLMTEADTKNGDLPDIAAYGRHRNSGLIGSAGTRGNDQTAGSQLADLLYGNLVIAIDPDLFSQLPQVLDNVESEGIVVVDHQEQISLSPSPRSLWPF